MKARKDYPESGIKKGEEYYHWKFRFGGIHRSKTPPKPSQLTQSEFLSTLYDLQERLGNLQADNAEDLKTDVEEIASELRDLGQDCQGKLDNMPDGLQQGETGQLLEQRADSCENAADELEGIDFEWSEVDTLAEIKDEEPDIEEDDLKEELERRKQDRLEEILQEVQGVDLSFE